jgi:hypothetical protein
MSMFNLSYEGYCGLSQKTWNVIWSFTENGFALFILILIANLTVSSLSIFIQFVPIPYFIIKLIYHTSCYAGLHLLSSDLWQSAWSYILIIQIIVGIGFYLTLIHSKNGKMENPL